MLEYQLYY